jgi:uncharacterized protein (DUF1778 family)
MQQETAMTPPKPKSPHPKINFLQIRLNDVQMELVTQAAKLTQTAELNGFTVSGWARSVLIAEARKVLRRAREQ